MKSIKSYQDVRWRTRRITDKERLVEVVAVGLLRVNEVAFYTIKLVYAYVLCRHSMSFYVRQDRRPSVESRWQVWVSTHRCPWLYVAIFRVATRLHHAGVSPSPMQSFGFFAAWRTRSRSVFRSRYDCRFGVDSRCGSAIITTIIRDPSTIVDLYAYPRDGCPFENAAMCMSKSKRKRHGMRNVVVLPSMRVRLKKRAIALVSSSGNKPYRANSANSSVKADHLPRFSL